MRKMLLILLFMFSCLNAIEYTQDDRDRLIKLESKVEEGFKGVDRRFEQVDKRFEQADKRFDELKEFMMWGFSILFGGMGLMIGVVIWDRRTFLAPLSRELEELKDRESRLERLVKELLTTSTQFQEIAKRHGYSV